MVNKILIGFFFVFNFPRYLGVLDLISGGSRSTTPTASLMVRKSPTADKDTQVGHQQQHSGNVGKIGDKTNVQRMQQPHRDRERYYFVFLFLFFMIKKKRYFELIFVSGFVKKEIKIISSHGSGRVGSGMSQYSEGKRDKQDGMGHGPSGHIQGPRGNRGGWMNRGNMRGRGRGRGNFRSNQPGNTGAKPKNTLKFDNDYDFEQANTEFEELRYDFCFSFFLSFIVE